MKAVAYQRSLPVEEAESLLDVELPDPVVQGRDLLIEVEHDDEGGPRPARHDVVLVGADADVDAAPDRLVAALVGPQHSVTRLASFLIAWPPA